MQADVRIILVGSLYSRNVGSTARAMQNFGAERLILIRPQCDLGLQAYEGAASAQKILDGCVSYESWDGFFASEPEGALIAFTARPGRRRELQTIAEILPAWETTLRDRPLYLVFGPEDSGLSQEDVDRAHACATLRIPGPNKSLNLSQAVLLALKECFDIAGPDWNPVVLPDHRPSSDWSSQALDQSLKNWLEALGMELREEANGAYRVLRRLIMKGVPTQKEARVLEAALHQTARKLRGTKPSLPNASSEKTPVTESVSIDDRREQDLR